MATYLPILEESIYLSIYFSRRRWPSTYLSRRRWPPLPTYLGGDGHVSNYLGKDCHLSIYLRKDGQLPLHLEESIWSKNKRPRTYLSRRRWPPLATYLGGDGQQSTYPEKDGQLFIYFAGVYLSVYLVEPQNVFSSIWFFNLVLKNAFLNMYSKTHTCSFESSPPFSIWKNEQ